MSRLRWAIALVTMLVALAGGLVFTAAPSGALPYVDPDIRVGCDLSPLGCDGHIGLAVT